MPSTGATIAFRPQNTQRLTTREAIASPFVVCGCAYMYGGAYCGAYCGAYGGGRCGAPWVPTP
jgi:hypothetical protein